MTIISVLHTIPQSIAPLDQAFACLDHCEVRHYVDAGIVKDVAPDGSVDNATLRRFAASALHAAQGADILIIACTICCRFAAVISPILQIPVLTADGPMLRAAASVGRQPGIVATRTTSAVLCQNTLYEYMGHQVPTRQVIVSKADDFSAVEAACITLERQGCDLIILAQLSMAPAKMHMTEVHCPVFTSPEFLAGEVSKLIPVKNKSHSERKVLR